MNFILLGDCLINADDIRRIRPVKNQPDTIYVTYKSGLVEEFHDVDFLSLYAELCKEDIDEI